MKKIVTYFTLALCLILGNHSATASSTEEEIIVIIDEDYEKDKKDIDPKGLRKPSAPVTSTIDFTNYRIETNRLADIIISYELWDDSGEILIALYFDDRDMVKFLLTVNGVYQLRIVTRNTIYSGIIEL